MIKDNRRGSQAVEFALIFPVFLTLVFGGLDYSWYVLQKYTAMDVVSAGCRAGAITGVDLYAEPITFERIRAVAAGQGYGRINLAGRAVYKLRVVRGTWLLTV